jgi:hypothetical protein
MLCMYAVLAVVAFLQHVLSWSSIHMCWLLQLPLSNGTAPLFWKTERAAVHACGSTLAHA